MIYESGEMYLETILVLHKHHEIVRAIDVANERKYSKPSVSRAINVLKQKNYLSVEKNGNLILTDRGEALANSIFERHQFITQYLIQELRIDPRIAEDDACRIEHVISTETFDKMKEKLNFK